MRNNSLSLVAAAAWVCTCFIGVSRGEIVSIIPSLDNSIFSESSNSNALGDLFAGRNSQASLQIRRALLQFDIAGSVPAGATINSVSLGLFQLGRGGGSTVESFQLQPLLASWGEGTSLASGGGGIAATSGDATWNHRFFSTTSWSASGGDFGPISGTGTIGTGIDTQYTFASQPGLVADVQSWLDSPTSNFGWILRASNESTPSNARVFASSENVDASLRPTLLIDYTAVPEPGSVILIGLASVLVLARRRVK
jgi:hypothetical protein